MGNFYTQVLVRESDERRCADVMRSLGRRSYVIPSHNGVSVVCDSESENHRHARIAEILGLPPRSVGAGYRYISVGDVGGPFDKAGIIET